MLKFIQHSYDLIQLHLISTSSNDEGERDFIDLVYVCSVWLSF